MLGRCPASSRPPTPTTASTTLKAQADAAPGGVVDLSIGTPCDPRAGRWSRRWPTPTPSGRATPPPIGLAAAAGRGRRLDGTAPGRESLPTSQVVACVGTKELVASLPHPAAARPEPGHGPLPGRVLPHLRDGRPAGRAAGRPRPVAGGWHLDLAPSPRRTPPGRCCCGSTTPATRPARPPTPTSWPPPWPGPGPGVIVASDECYVEFTWDRGQAVPAPPPCALAWTGSWPSTRCRSGRTWPATGAASSPATATSPPTWGRSAPTPASWSPGRCRPPPPWPGATTPTWKTQRAVYAERIAWSDEALPDAGLIDAGGPGTLLPLGQRRRRRRRLGHHRPTGRLRDPGGAPATSTGRAAPTTPGSPCPADRPAGPRHRPSFLSAYLNRTWRSSARRPGP